MPRPFLIYRSSAGSGKTYAITREYLKLALRYPDAFTAILGVTFTNKATEEMKSRIIEVLRTMSLEKSHSMKSELMESLKIDEVTLREKSKNALKSILHNYGRFSVVTIDSFFHHVIRSFAREIGIQGSFTIDLDTDRILSIVIDELLADLGEADKKSLRHWLTRFAETNVNEGKSWDFRYEISALAQEIMKDDFKRNHHIIASISKDSENFEQVLNSIQSEIKSFEQKCELQAKKGLEMINSAGGVDVFKRKGSGPAGLFIRIINHDYTVSETRRNAASDITGWLIKGDLSNPELTGPLENEILPLYAHLIAFIDEQHVRYNSLIEVQRYFFTFGILNEISIKLKEYRADHDVLLIADLPDFLQQIINDSETPFIYDKIGTRYEHFLIDEFQDTSEMQWDNFKPLVKNGVDAGQSSMIVGDLKQSIYRWRGGDWSLLGSRINNDIGDYHIKEEFLETNYRSSKQIIDFNNLFFERIPEIASEYIGDHLSEDLEAAIEAYGKIKQKHAESSSEGGEVHFEFISTEHHNWQNEAIARTIERVEKLQGEGFELRDIAILTRTQREGKRITDAFMSHKSGPNAMADRSYEVVSSESLFLFSSHAVKMIISLLKWIDHEDDQIAMAEWYYEYSQYLSGKQTNLNVIFNRLNDWRSQVPDEFLKNKNHLKTLPVFELIESIIRIFKLNTIKNELTYLQGFQDAVLDYTKNERGDIPAFLVWWENVRKKRAIQIADENNAIKVLTIHKAKGLEFPIVIIPFLNWKLDHDTYSKQEIMWCEGGQDEVIKKLPIVPLRYSKNIGETYWEKEYWKEKISAFIDSVNLLYVAFTRPVNGFYAFTEYKEGQKLSHVGHLAYHVLEKSEAWNKNKLSYSIGNLVHQVNRKESKGEYGLKKYGSYPWRNKIMVQLKKSQELSGFELESQKWGISLHSALSKVKTMEDLTSSKDEYLKREVKLIIHHEEILPFFTDVDEVKIEVPILIPGGSYKRIDRLIRKKDEWWVVDFKTGTSRKKDQHQVNEYMEILEEMGLEKLKGFLIYLDPVQIIEVKRLLKTS